MISREEYVAMQRTAHATPHLIQTLEPEHAAMIPALIEKGLMFVDVTQGELLVTELGFMEMLAHRAECGPEERFTMKGNP